MHDFGFGKLTDKEKLILFAVGIGAFLLAPKIAGKVAYGTASAVAETAGNVIIDGATGAVVGIGKAVGVPETSLTKCQQDIANGDMWRASFDCPATTYLKALWGSTFGS